MTLEACRNHPTTDSSATCRDCSAPLCEACTREAMGHAFCQACLEARLEAAPASSVVPGPKTKSPGLATLASVVIGGLGQVYAGFLARGLVIFAAWWAGISLIANVGFLNVLLVPAWLAFWIWQAIDAHGCARDVNGLGRVPTPEEAHAMGRGSLFGVSADARGFGIALVVVGAILFLQQFAGALVAGLRYAFPVALLVAGALVLRRSRRRDRSAGSEPFIDATPVEPT